MKIGPLGAELFHADRRIDMTKLIVAYRDFANATKNPSNNFLKCIRNPAQYPE
jgi:hypothetical protein